jgi:hypothetical protein
MTMTSLPSLKEAAEVRAQLLVTENVQLFGRMAYTLALSEAQEEIRRILRGPNCDNLAYCRALKDVSAALVALMEKTPGRDVLAAAKEHAKGTTP